jgi:hypothetical protein
VSLDVFVMPLWKFKVGDFTPPIESALGVRPKYASPDGIVEQPTSSWWWERCRARREVAAIRKSMAKVNRAAIRWKDEGRTVFSCQWPDFTAIRAYTTWLDCRDRLPEFTTPPENDYHKHPVFEQEIERLSCPQLVQHGLYNGYFLPCDFELMGDVEPYTIFGHWPASRPVGSTPRLLRELDSVQEHLQVPDDYKYDEKDPLNPVKQDYRQLRKAAELSVRHGLPIIFWG